MSLHRPAVQLARTAARARAHVSAHPPILPPARRTLFEWLRPKKRRPDQVPEPALDPTSEAFRQRKAAVQKARQPARPGGRGDISASSIFDDPDERPAEDAAAAPRQPGAIDPQRLQRIQYDPYLSAPALDPRPRARRRWLQRQVARAVRNQGAVSRALAIRRREREHLTRSEWLPTSVKKLMPLARQVAGQSVEHAIVQLRFSKKAVAQDVRRILEAARDEAMVVRGMGLGAHARAAADTSLAAPKGGAADTASATAAAAAPEAATADATAADATTADTTEPNATVDATPVEAAVTAHTAEAETPAAPPVHIVDKRGKRRTITDPTALYIAQAWVSRGPYGKMPEYRARGRVNLLRPPYTSISFLLKEEATRIREAAERIDRVRRRKPWMHHPDRPVTQQQQYVLW